ncbi:plastocyanin [Azoarcus sp. TTM-91]|uniref:Plastocyanin n=1 Tax=Azoarcus indigens TaxID=29545 RepID=A0A4R6EEE0_9RHOO|nr:MULTISPECIES: plastocyanin/azurin family copper-binding protein [Azoarcus]NMG35964.1 plastocyanin [Azoarcus sp. TTM-91]NMG67598.1 plastocyanin [Azoarcus indigens]TDN56114.1 plastocyanin [Azoarcus indigens]
MKPPGPCGRGAGCALAALAAALLLLASPAWGAEHRVEVVDYAYRPAELTIQPGDTVTWSNREKRVSHSVLFDASGQESERFFPGESWSHTFEAEGEFAYHCGPHPEMKGRVVVRGQR